MHFLSTELQAFDKEGLYHYSHYTRRETEASRGEVTCQGYPNSAATLVVENTRPLGASSAFYAPDHLSPI